MQNCELNREPVYTLWSYQVIREFRRRSKLACGQPTPVFGQFDSPPPGPTMTRLASWSQGTGWKACDTLFVATSNVTLTLPEDRLRRMKILAARRDTSISALIASALPQWADEEKGYAEAREGMLADLALGYDLRTHGKITWSRDSLHER